MDDIKLLTDAAKVGVAAWASKDLAGKILGPTFEYLGGEIRNLAEKCNLNLTNIFLKASRILGDDVNVPGQVSPRVLKSILDEGAFCDDEVAAEYFAGVLAASRSEIGDDRGISYLALLRDLSAYQIRAHYIIYRVVKNVLDGRALRLSIAAEAKYMRLFFQEEALHRNLVGDADKPPSVVVSYIFNGLARHSLIASEWQGGSAAFMKRQDDRLMEPGYLITPTAAGAELFMWAHGRADVPVGRFLDKDVVFSEPPTFSYHGGASHLPPPIPSR